MKRTLVQYRVAVERAEENGAAVAAVFAELRRLEPSGLRYAVFELDDGATFVHVSSIETADGTNPLSALPVFQEFTAGVKARCLVAPVFQELREVDSYEFFSK